MFRDPGFAVPGADVVLAPATDAGAGSKGKKQKTTTDARGEFVFRVAPEPMNYVVTASSKGYKTLAKPVQVQGEERVDVTFMLEQESK